MINREDISNWWRRKNTPIRISDEWAIELDSHLFQISIDIKKAYPDIHPIVQNDFTWFIFNEQYGDLITNALHNWKAKNETV